MDIAGQTSSSMDFVLVKKDESEPLAKSKYSGLSERSVNLETTLIGGTYIVYVRLDQSLDRNEVHGPLTLLLLIIDQGEQKKFDISSFDARKFSRILAERTESQSIATSTHSVDLYPVIESEIFPDFSPSWVDTQDS